MSELKRTVIVETDGHLERLDATSFGVVDGHALVQDGDHLVGAFAAGAWVSLFFEDAQSARVASAA